MNISSRRGVRRGRIALSMALGLVGGLLASGATLAVTATTAGATAPTPPFNECPPVGVDTGCAILIVINNTGAEVLTDPTQTPYDGIEDTLIGVLNDTTSTTVTGIPLSGGSNAIFDFDGDGACDPNSGTTSFSPGTPGRQLRGHGHKRGSLYR